MVRLFNKISAVLAMIILCFYCAFVQNVYAQTMIEQMSGYDNSLSATASPKADALGVLPNTAPAAPIVAPSNDNTKGILDFKDVSQNSAGEDRGYRPNDMRHNSGGNNAATPAIANIPHDLSPIGMFLAADKIVKSVMIGLALASVATWTIFVVKVFELAGAKRKARAALEMVNNAQSLAKLSEQMQGIKGMAPILASTAQKEVQASLAALDVAGSDGLKERISSSLSRLVVAAGRKIAAGTSILATIGAIGPFVGLFGTVWGIMNSFIGISQAQTTNLAVVAPGIAEALLATAIGLVAAIPAVIIYNVFARSITGYRQQLVDVSAGIERLVSRDLDFRKLKQQTTNISSRKAANVTATIGDDLAIAAE